MNKDLVSGFDLTIDDINKIFALASQFKEQKLDTILKGKVIGLIFQKPSMRTRVSFEVGACQLGADCIYFAPQDIKLGDREPVGDIAGVLTRYIDLIVARTFLHQHVLDLSAFAGISVINGLSDLYHPCQALADVYTIYEKTGTYKDIKLAYVGDGNNVAHSLLAVAAKVGLSVSVATPIGYEPQKDILEKAQEIAKQNNAEIVYTDNPVQAVKDADFIYTDVWVSMGQENTEKKLQDFQAFQVNAELLRKSGKHSLIMHCMPMHRGQEITEEIIGSENSIIFEQAENRLHTQKGIMALLLGGQEH
ncbi:MAG: ornithine carbamoyltransferase [Candidatus Omnitrophota bacterium]|nr:MAG: ornithine carbamoyltransferase [Candidatus Omnitrophota bacterium]